MTDDEKPETASARVIAARARVAEATAAHERAQAAVDETRRARTGRGDRTHLIAAVSTAAVAVVLIVTTAVLVSITGRGRAETDRAAEVLAAARDGITTALTADPSRSTQYVAGVVAVSTGEFRARITASAAEIASSVASQPFPGTGQVISAGIVGADPRSSDPGSGADVLVVAEATNPQLLGGGAGDARVVLLVRMTRVDGSWKIERAQLQ